MLISIIIPVYNEENNIRPLAEALGAVMRGKVLCAGETFQIIFVDDGSTDGSLSELKLLARNSPDRQPGLSPDRPGQVSYISFSRNFGQQAALRAGMEAASGDCIITMDGDFQHPPELLPLMIAEFRKGFDIVNTRRSEPAHGRPGRNSVLKRATSRLFYSLINAVEDVPVEPGSADFRLISRRACDRLLAMGQSSIFLRAAIPWLGLPSTTLSYVAEPRKSGKTKFTPAKMFNLAEEGLATTNSRFFRITSCAGVGFLFAGLVFLICRLCLLAFTGEPFGGWAIVLCLLLIIGGALLVSIGFTGHYIVRLISLTGGKPPYIIKESTPGLGERLGRKNG